jgi:predicted metal-dependent hydrolase
MSINRSKKMNKIGKVPEFADDGSSEEVKETETTEEVVEEEEKETPPESSEGEKPTEEALKISSKEKVSVEEKKNALEGLRKTEEDLREDDLDLDKEIERRRQNIVDLRTKRREKRDLVQKINDRIPESEVDTLSDVDTTTLQILDRYTRAKGLIPRTEVEQMTYNSVHKNAERDFYEKHIEYLPENDKNDFLYNALQKELNYYAKPSDPSLISKLFEKAHKTVKEQYPQSFKNLQERINAEARTKLASAGGGVTGGNRPQAQPSHKTNLSSRQKEVLLAGGWTEEEIKNLSNE